MRHALAALVALSPGLLVWLWGRRLLGATGDPALAERVLAWRQRSTLALATGVALLVVLFPSHLPWALPLLALVFLSGGFPARRALHGERWGLLAYLAHVVRLVVSLAGFWVLLMAAPALVSGAGAWRWGAAAALATVLLLWGFAHDRVLLWVLGAEPLDRPDLQPRLGGLAARSSAPLPRLFVIGPHGGRWTNAFALPSTRRPAVAFTRALLETFDADEIVAVFAHEQAHLEHFDRRRLLRLGAVQTAAILVGTLGAATALGFLERAALLATVGWPLAVALVLLLRVARHRAHESDSDRRAAELCGDPAALARALVKLHALALLPRRLDVEHEQWASHPSLANRLRSLRALAPPKPDAAGPASGQPLPIAAPSGPPAALARPAAGPPFALAGETPGEWLVLESEQAHWLEGVPEGTLREPAAVRAAARRGRSVAYTELVELRLQPRGRKGLALVATDRAGASWAVSLAPGEAQAAQVALDTVDDRLLPPAAAKPSYRGVASLVAAAGTLFALFALSAAVIPGLVAVVLPHPGALAAFGAAAVMAALVSPHPAPAPLIDWVPVFVRPAALVLLGLGALGLGGATAWRERAGRTRSAPWIALLMALAATFALLPVVAALATGSLLRVHVAARQSPSGAVLFVAATAALTVTPRVRTRVLAVIPGTLALLTLAVGTEPWGARFVRDPLWPPPLPPSPPARALRFLAEHEVPTGSGDLRLSPSGRSWATRVHAGSEHDSALPRPRLVVGPANGLTRAHHVLDVALVDDTRLLALSAAEKSLGLTRRSHDPEGSEDWHLALPDLLSPRLDLDASTGAWRVVGLEPGSGELVRLTGDLAGASPRESRWPAADLAGQWLVSAGPVALGTSYAVGPELGLEDDVETHGGASLWWLLAGMAGGAGSRLVALDSSGARPLLSSQMTVQCDAPPPGQATFLCRAHDGGRTSLWGVEAGAGSKSLLGVVEGFAWPPRPAAPGGVVLANAGMQQELHRLGRGEVVRLERPEATDEWRWIHGVAAFDEGVGLLVTVRNGRTRLRVYAWGDGARGASTADVTPGGEAGGTDAP